MIRGVLSDLHTRLRYAVSELRDNIDDPDWRRGRVHARINGPVQRAIHGEGFDMPGAEWDTLIILDACRADLFESVVDTGRWDGYETKYSGAGATNRWLERQWNGTYGDTVYVAGNPMVSRHVPGSFHHLIECWREAVRKELNGPDPAVVTEAAVAAHEEYPDKRVVVHYMQPHYPFIQDPELTFTSFRNTEEWTVEGDDRAGDVWGALRAGLVEEGPVREAYARNLEFVMAEVDELLETIDGRAVVTADHGNLIGEWTYPIPYREYGHPAELVQPDLTTVPWAVRDGERRRTTASDVQSSADATADEVSEQLQALGYAE
jgi:hypothetical protein